MSSLSASVPWYCGGTVLETTSSFACSRPDSEDVIAIASFSEGMVITISAAYAGG